MINSSLSPIRAALTAVVVLSLAGCGSNTAGQEGPQVEALDARATSSIIVDAGACGWPASVTSSEDASSVGCWAKASFDICEVPNGGAVNGQDGTIRGPDGQVVTDACKNACSATEYALSCIGDSMLPSSIPAPDSSLGCTLIPVPAPSHVLSYCCPCK